MLIIIFGDVGTGKTQLATMIACKDDRPILANYTIRDERWKQLEPQMLNDIHEPTLVIIDEAYAWLESRLSGKDINRYLSYTLFQSRKRGIDFILTVQMLSTVDVRFRQMADMYILCELAPHGFVYTILFPGKRGKRVLSMTVETAAKYWNKYDTMELVSPIDDDLLFKVTPNKSEVLPEIDKIIEDLESEMAASKWTKGMISDYCMDKMLANSYVDIIFNRIKRKAAKARQEDEDGQL